MSCGSSLRPYSNNRPFSRSCRVPADLLLCHVTTGKPIHSNTAVCVLTFAFEIRFNDFQREICKIYCSTIEKMSVRARCNRIWLPATSTCRTCLTLLIEFSCLSILISKTLRVRLILSTINLTN